MDSKKIGEKLRELRGDQPQSDVANAVGVTPMAISLYEAGERIPRDEIKKALANYYGVSVESIFFVD